jgi:uncharacterized spore protein YtfJ
MDVLQAVADARDALTVKRVYGDPVEKDGTTVIPSARVAGGGGGGGGHGPEGVGEGEGTGFGLAARPAGVYVVRGKKVRWVPAVDPVQILMASFLILMGVRSVLKVLLARRGVPKEVVDG